LSLKPRNESENIFRALFILLILKRLFIDKYLKTKDYVCH
jgi:hypothetical protein